MCCSWAELFPSEFCFCLGGDPDAQLSECDQWSRAHLPHCVPGPPVQGNRSLRPGCPLLQPHLGHFTNASPPRPGLHDPAASCHRIPAVDGQNLWGVCALIPSRVWIGSRIIKECRLTCFSQRLNSMCTQLLFVFRRSCLFTHVQRRNTPRRFWTSWTRRENCLGKCPPDLLRRRVPCQIDCAVPASVCLLLVPAVTCRLNFRTLRGVFVVPLISWSVHAQRPQVDVKWIKCISTLDYYKFWYFSHAFDPTAYIVVRLIWFLPPHKLHATQTHQTNKITEQVVTLFRHKDETERRISVSGLFQASLEQFPLPVTSTTSHLIG